MKVEATGVCASDLKAYHGMCCILAQCGEGGPNSGLKTDCLGMCHLSLHRLCQVLGCRRRPQQTTVDPERRHSRS